MFNDDNENEPSLLAQALMAVAAALLMYATLVMAFVW